MTILLYHPSVILFEELHLKKFQFLKKQCSFCILQDHLVECSKSYLIQLLGKREKAWGLKRLNGLQNDCQYVSNWFSEIALLCVCLCAQGWCPSPQCFFCILKLVFANQMQKKSHIHHTSTHPPKGKRYVTLFKTGVATGFKVNLSFILVAGIKHSSMSSSTVHSLRFQTEHCGTWINMGKKALTAKCKWVY